MSSSRRSALKSIALSVTMAGIPLEAGQQVHRHVEQTKKKAAGVYKPRLLNAHEFRTVRRLAELIIPADDVSGSAVDAGAPEFIDLIAANNGDIGLRISGGLAWLDRFSEKRTGKRFAEAAASDQTSILDVIAYRKNETPELAPGIVFFDWMRRLTTDAFYTSPIGTKDLGYRGNKGMTTFEVPASAIEYAVKRSGLE